MSNELKDATDTAKSACNGLLGSNRINMLCQKPLKDLTREEYREIILAHGGKITSNPDCDWSYFCFP